jgi:hypothetical protein
MFNDAMDRIEKYTSLFGSLELNYSSDDSVSLEFRARVTSISVIAKLGRSGVLVYKMRKTCSIMKNDEWRGYCSVETLFESLRNFVMMVAGYEAFFQDAPHTQDRERNTEFAERLVVYKAKFIDKCRDLLIAKYSSLKGKQFGNDHPFLPQSIHIDKCPAHVRRMTLGQLSRHVLGRDTKASRKLLIRLLSSMRYVRYPAIRDLIRQRKASPEMVDRLIQVSDCIPALTSNSIVLASRDGFRADDIIDTAFLSDDVVWNEFCYPMITKGSSHGHALREILSTFEQAYRICPELTPRKSANLCLKYNKVDMVRVLSSFLYKASDIKLTYHSFFEGGEFNFANDDATWRMRTPKDSIELADAGEELSNCLQSYRKRHNEDSFILLIYRNDKLYAAAQARVTDLFVQQLYKACNRPLSVNEQAGLVSYISNSPVLKRYKDTFIKGSEMEEEKNSKVSLKQIERALEFRNQEREVPITAALPMLELPY